MRFWLIFKILLHPIRYAQDRIDEWVMARVKRQPGPVHVPRRRVYIVPTRFGYLFGAMLMVMLLGAMNYSNSMAFALTFTLSALGLVCMHHTHANLVNLTVRALRVEPVFAGEEAHFELELENPAPRVRYSIEFTWARTRAALRASRLPPPLPQTVDASAVGITKLKLGLPAAQRGWLRAGIFSVATEFPLGLFHAWTWMELDIAGLVYPKPAPPGPRPPPTPGQGGRSVDVRAGQDEFAGLRSYQRGDAIRSIHWKSLPKLREPMVKQFSDTLDDELWLDWNSLTGREAEARLSQLTRWVLEAEGNRRPYGLRLPSLELEPQIGPAHQRACLGALALFEAPA